MAWLRCRIETDKPYLAPFEAMAEVDTEEGKEFVLVHRSLVQGTDLLETSWPLSKKDGYVLIELPMEAESGARRVWVKPEALAQETVR